MRTIAALLAAFLLASCAACTSPLAPSGFTCYTQPRAYFNPATGATTYEVDHYEQATPCPATPIK